MIKPHFLSATHTAELAHSTLEFHTINITFPKLHQMFNLIMHQPTDSLPCATFNSLVSLNSHQVSTLILVHLLKLIGHYGVSMHCLEHQITLSTSCRWLWP